MCGCWLWQVVKERSEMMKGNSFSTKLLSAYCRRGPNMEALRQALARPLSTVLSKKEKLNLEVLPSKVYRAKHKELEVCACVCLSLPLSSSPSLFLYFSLSVILRCWET